MSKLIDKHMKSLITLYRFGLHNTGWDHCTVAYLRELLSRVEAKISITPPTIGKRGQATYNRLRALEAIRADILIELLLMDQG